MNHYFQFLKNPNLPKYNNHRSPLLPLYLFYLGLALFFTMIFFFIKLLFDLPDNEIYKVSNYSFNEKLLKIIILAPLIEEVIFRLLLRFNRSNVKLFFFISIIYLILFIFLKKYVVASLILTIQIFLLIILIIKSINEIELWFKNNFRFVFYFSFISYGLVHLSNYNQITTTVIFLSPILVFPQILLGSIIGYIRINYSFLHGLFFHMLINLLVLF